MCFFWSMKNTLGLKRGGILGHPLYQDEVRQGILLKAGMCMVSFFWRHFGGKTWVEPFRKKIKTFLYHNSLDCLKVSL